MATYVLVHGGQHGGWCWQRVSASLRAAGHEVYTPTLTGLGERSHLITAETGLDTHIRDVVGVLEYEDIRSAILVGHSYGGMVISGVADRALNRVGHLVYLDAAIPRDGESLADLAPEAMNAAHAAARVVDGVELVAFPDETFLDLMGVTEQGDREWMAARLSPHPWKAFAQPISLPNQAGVQAVPQTVIITPSRIRGDEDRMEGARSADRLWRIDAGHDLMITEPEATTEMLLRVSSATSAAR